MVLNAVYEQLSTRRETQTFRRTASFVFGDLLTNILVPDIHTRPECLTSLFQCMLGLS